MRVTPIPPIARRIAIYQLAPAALICGLTGWATYDTSRLLARTIRAALNPTQQ